MADTEGEVSGLSVVERKILDMITQAAEAGEKCPINQAMADAVGCKERSVSRVIHNLATMGLISVERNNTVRLVTITATGKRTHGEIRKAEAKRPESLIYKHIVIPEKAMPDPAPRRDPCFFCAVPADRHEQFGCRQWRGMVA